VNILIPNNLTSAIFVNSTEPPESYPSVLIPSEKIKGFYDSSTNYNAGDVVKETYDTSYTNSSDSDYVAWYMCNRDDTVGYAPHSNPLYWTMLTPDNKTAYRDKYIDTQTVSKVDTPLSIQFTSSMISHICCFNIDCKYLILQSDSINFRLHYELIIGSSEVSSSSISGSQTFIVPKEKNNKIESGHYIKITSGTLDGTIFQITHIDSFGRYVIDGNHSISSNTTYEISKTSQFLNYYTQDMEEQVDWILGADYGIHDVRYMQEFFFKVPTEQNITYTVTLTNDTILASSGYVGIGKLVAGTARKIGYTLSQPQINLMSMTVKERDKSGYTYYDKQNTYKEVSYKVDIENSMRSATYRLFESIDAVDCVFMPTDDNTDTSIVCYGSYNNFSLIREDSNNSSYNITVEGTI
jgi:hypothetical protein